MQLKQYKYVKEETTAIEWELPTEAKYYFETGIRRSISVTPRWTTWEIENGAESERIYSLHIVCVYQSFEAKIEAFSIDVGKIEDLYYNSSKHKNDPEVDIIQFLIDDPSTQYIRTKENFEGDLNNCLGKVKKHLEF